MNRRCYCIIRRPYHGFVVLGQSTSMFRPLKSRAVIVTGWWTEVSQKESEDPISISEWSGMGLDEATSSDRNHLR
jgi:hypothetical protein